MANWTLHLALAWWVRWEFLSSVRTCLRPDGEQLIARGNSFAPVTMDMRWLPSMLAAVDAELNPDCPRHPTPGTSPKSPSAPWVSVSSPTNQRRYCKVVELINHTETETHESEGGTKSHTWIALLPPWPLWSASPLLCAPAPLHDSVRVASRGLRAEQQHEC
jgi:hypothetical protein